MIEVFSQAVTQLYSAKLKEIRILTSGVEVMTFRLLTSSDAAGVPLNYHKKIVGARLLKGQRHLFMIFNNYSPQAQ